MGEFVGKAVAILNEKLGGKGFDGVAKIVLKDEGSLILDQSGARESDESGDVTLTASVETFIGILEGETNATAAFMMGKLTVDGDMGLALKLASVLG
jgi:putative sterol carrier protein